MMLQPQEEDKSHFTPPKAMHLWTLLLSDLTTLFSSLLTSSHPLYIAYLLFFSPHILTLLSFFCPLLLSTFLLLLTISPNLVFHVDSPALRLFRTLSMSLMASSPPSSEASVVFGVVIETLCWVVLDSEVPMQANSAIMEVEEMFEENSHSESDEHSELSPMPSYEVRVNQVVEENWLLTESESDRSFCDSTNSSKSSESPMYDAREFGSMRKEKKEWERTLACKIYEERKAASDGGEGMDVLWEIYEAETRNSNASKKKKKKDLKEERVIEGVQEEDEEEEEEEEEMTGKICCLQALKFTAKGKVNFGMGRPGLVKFSKALKGLRMFKHSKKV
ncbi:hypothetical protein QJS04_geneDACA023334 [Acorus gramineus]|uniref:Uncharacterized protein n=1 Tax=Acorus gramineus TaxID=55184 RepID=A0AAV9A669_ACOGR|nr:hypothetical protein QJS04_geneDACA023334 [Acorus gramineus]